MYCAKCGKMINEGYKFCIGCGTPVPELQNICAPSSVNGTAGAVGEEKFFKILSIALYVLIAAFEALFLLIAVFTKFGSLETFLNDGYDGSYLRNLWDYFESSIFMFAPIAIAVGHTTGAVFSTVNLFKRYRQRSFNSLKARVVVGGIVNSIGLFVIMIMFGEYINASAWLAGLLLIMSRAAMVIVYIKSVNIESAALYNEQKELAVRRQAEEPPKPKAPVK